VAPVLESANDAPSGLAAQAPKASAATNEMKIGLKIRNLCIAGFPFD
jgi:hypothetical protein